MTDLPTLVCLVGPTGSGKTGLAIEVAGRLRSDTEKPITLEVLNFDSVQFFTDLNIGAAKPSEQEQVLVRHHLLGHRPLGSSYTAGDFRREATAIVETRKDLNKHLLAVGGSGFYLQALEKGMYDVPEIRSGVREDLEQAVAAGELTRLHEEIRQRDPETAARVHPNDRYRVLRALEILRSHPDGTLAEIRRKFASQAPPLPFRAIKFGLTLSREELHRRLQARTAQMLKAGLIDEVAHLRALGFADWAPMKSVGYLQTQMYLRGELTSDELPAAILTSSMQLAKRQMTWFKRDAQITWLDATDSAAAGHVLTEAVRKASV